MAATRWLTMLSIAVLACPASAAPLAEIERTIAREPQYQTQPKYCLLVFGPEAQTRVWIVQDGGVLYVDRNGNGDLTEPDEKVLATKGDEADAAEGVFNFTAGDISDGPLTHKALKVSVSKLERFAEDNREVKALLREDPQARGYFIGIDTQVPGSEGVGLGGRIEQLVSYADSSGLLQFAASAKEAPIIHFGGPLCVTLYGSQRLTIGREADLILAVGTPGLGRGTTAYVGYQRLIPEDVFPTAEVVYPSAGAGESPVRELYELKERC